jgi:hypothetical protein
VDPTNVLTKHKKYIQELTQKKMQERDQMNEAELNRNKLQKNV